MRHVVVSRWAVTPKACHNAGGHGHVGLRDEVAGNGDLDAEFRVRSGHEQGGEVLRAGLSWDGGRASGQSTGVDDDGRAVGAGLAGSVGAEVGEGAEQWADRALAHAWDAVDAVAAFSKGEGGYQKAHRGARVSDEEVCLLGREGATTALDAE